VITTTAIDAVLLDCDSTLSTVEGIDELALRAGVSGDCRELTRAAMDGDLPLEAVYAKRLELIQPSRSDTEWLSKHYIKHLTTGAETLVNMLYTHGIDVYIISGGLKPAVLGLAKALGVAGENVYAVDIFLSDGKAMVCIGDGVTDLEMKMANVLFIGYGGVQYRERVRREADVYIEDQSLMLAWPYIATGNRAQGG
jgi:phosphoserine phosphatase